VSTPTPTATAGEELAALAVERDLDLGLARPVVAAGTVAAVVAVLAGGRWLRLAEAAVSEQVARAVGTHDVQRIGTAVTFDLDGRAVGYGITLGCTVAFLLVPFLLAAGLVLTLQRASAPRTLAALGAAVAVVALTNQVRLLVILCGIRALGLERGYSATHVLVGTAVSTVGVVSAALLFLAVVTRGARGVRRG
jgi:exosortase/archaeosortase family protein